MLLLCAIVISPLSLWAHGNHDVTERDFEENFDEITAHALVHQMESEEAEELKAKPQDSASDPQNKNLPISQSISLK